jgi:hypothetical protein
VPWRPQDPGCGEPGLLPLRKRRLLVTETERTYRLGPGDKWAPERIKPATDLTHEMLQK